MSSYLKGLADKINGVDKQSFIQELDINSLVPSQNNFYGIREVQELAESIRESGLMHNLVVRKKDDGTYEIISGERRYRALKSLGYEKAPCQVKDISDLDAEIMLIQANVEQRELLPTEKMEGIRRLKSIYEQKKANGEQLPKGKVRDLIGQDMKLSGVQVGRYQKVDKDLIEPLKKKLDKEEITLTQAHTLSSLSEEEQEVIHEEIKALDPKEAKEEIEILVNGIKQPVESKLDKQLLNEMHPTIIKEESKENVFDADIYDTESKLKNAFKEFDHPRLIISNDYVKGIIYINKFSISNSILTIGDGDSKGSNLTIKINYFEKCDEVEIEVGNPNPIKPKILYKVSDDVFIWFKRRILSFMNK